MRRTEILLKKDKKGMACHVKEKALLKLVKSQTSNGNLSINLEIEKQSNS